MKKLSRRLFLTSSIAAPFVFRTGLVRAQGGRVRLSASAMFQVGPGQPYAQPQDAINDIMTNYDVAGFDANISLVGGTPGTPAIYNPFTVSGRAVGQNNGSLINIFGPDPALPQKVIILGKNVDAITVNEAAHAVLSNMQAQTYGGSIGAGKGFVCDGPGSRMDLSNCSAGNVNAYSFANVNGGFTRIYGARTDNGPSTNTLTLNGSPMLAVLCNLNDGSKFEFLHADFNLGFGLGAGYSDTNGYHLGYFMVGAQGYFHPVDLRIPNKVFAGMQFRMYQAAVFSDGGNTRSIDGFFPGTSFQLLEQSLYNGSLT